MEQNPGYTQAETEAFNNILNPAEAAKDANKFVMFGTRHPDTHHYTLLQLPLQLREKSLGCG